MPTGALYRNALLVFQASQGVTALRSGLAEGEKVVSSGLFLIDSEANILAHWSGCALKVLPMRIEGITND